MPKTQAKRVSKTSSGNGIRHAKTNLSHVQKINLGKGLMIGVAARWKIQK